MSLAISHPDDKYTFALTRLTETVVGIAVALAVNALIKHRPQKRGDADEEKPQNRV